MTDVYSAKHVALLRQDPSLRHSFIIQDFHHRRISTLSAYLCDAFISIPLSPFFHSSLSDHFDSDDRPSLLLLLLLSRERKHTHTVLPSQLVYIYSLVGLVCIARQLFLPLYNTRLVVQLERKLSCFARSRTIYVSFSARERIDPFLLCTRRTATYIPAAHIISVSSFLSSTAAGENKSAQLTRGKTYVFKSAISI